MSLAAGHLSYSKAIENSGIFAESQVFSGKTRKNARILLKTASSLSGIPLPTVGGISHGLRRAFSLVFREQSIHERDGNRLFLHNSPSLREQALTDGLLRKNAALACGAHYCFALRGEGGIRKSYIFSFNRLCKCLKYNMCIWVSWYEFVNS